MSMPRRSNQSLRELPTIIVGKPVGPTFEVVEYDGDVVASGFVTKSDAAKWITHPTNWQYDRNDLVIQLTPEFTCDR